MSPAMTQAALSPQLLAEIAAWSAQDPDPQTRATTEQLLTQAAGGVPDAVAELRSAFTGRLEFGTAGLRGAMGPGPNRMNRVVVAQAAAGLASYLLDHGLADGPVIIGYDARHKSAEFATDTAEIMAGAGFRAMLCDGPLPTPVIAFGIRHLGCVAGVVVTASHNPPQDNGYKVYLSDGSQIVPPADAEIADRINEITEHELADVPRAQGYQTIHDELVNAYLDRIETLVEPQAPRDLSWVYTPLHGVGQAVVDQAVARTGFPAPHPVGEQAAPDPDFPTVTFPNPEEPGAIDRAVAEAVRVDADLVIANDPDADRCAVALPGDGQWRMLRGDELGAVLGDDALRRGVPGTYACSIVSSSLLSKMAATHGQPFTYTLTGFKWIGRVPKLAFGYEEAIGYCVDPHAVPDKDGISTLVRVLALAAELKAEGSSLSERFDEIIRRYGIHHTDQLAFRVADLSLIAAGMARLRADPPTEMAGEPVVVADLAEGLDGLPDTDAVRITGESVTVVVRPSGTEPKLKCYLEVRRSVADSQDVEGARSTTAATITALKAEITQMLGL